MLLAVLIAAILTGAYFHSGRTLRPKVRTGNQNPLAPDFVLPQLDGTPLRLSSYRGKVVLLDFWATWCDPCREETPHFVELQREYADRGLQIIGVSMDDTSDPVRDFYQQFHLNYPVVMGNAKTGEAYGGVLGCRLLFCWTGRVSWLSSTSVRLKRKPSTGKLRPFCQNRQAEHH